MPHKSSGKSISLSLIKTACSNCNLRELCLPLGLTDEELHRLDDLVSNRRRLKRGDRLYRFGAPFDAIYAIRSGFFKTDVLLEDGREQVTGFQMSREIVRDHGGMMLLGTMRAEERLATFLLNLSQRFTARGFSYAEFNLRMTREEIGSYLGLKLETVSRAFSRFQEEGHIAVQQKRIRILNVAGLKALLNHRG